MQPNDLPGSHSGVYREAARAGVFEESIADELADIWGDHRARTYYQYELASETRANAIYDLATETHAYVSGRSQLNLSMATTDGTVEWRRDVGFGVWGPVAVTDELVYAAGQDANVVALDRTDGHVVWEVTKDGVEFVAPSVGGGQVYVGDSTMGTRYRTFYALDATTGDDLWQFEMRKVDMGDHAEAGLHTPPIIVDGGLFVATGAGELYAFSNST